MVHFQALFPFFLILAATFVAFCSDSGRYYNDIIELSISMTKTVTRIAMCLFGLIGFFFLLKHDTSVYLCFDLRTFFFIKSYFLSCGAFVRSGSHLLSCQRCCCGLKVWTAAGRVVDSGLKLPDSSAFQFSNL